MKENSLKSLNHEQKIKQFFWDALTLTISDNKAITLLKVMINSRM